MTVSFEMVLPGLAGHWVDGRIGTTPWLMLIGLAVGCTVAMWHLLRLTSPARQDAADDGTDEEGKP